MKPNRTIPRTVACVGALLLTAGMLSACTPESTPSPTPTAAFASEAEAFAAAEKVYREYNDALNARISGESSPDPREYLIGTALSDDTDGQELLRNGGIRLVGEIAVPQFIGTSADLRPTGVDLVAVVCLDVGDTHVLDSSGADVTPENRPSIVAQEVTMTYAKSTFLILRQVEAESSSCASS